MEDKKKKKKKKKKVFASLSTPEALRELILKQFPETAIYVGRDVPPIAGYFSTGSLSVDLNAGKGIPRGRITQYQGADGAFKTGLALHTIARAQKAQRDFQGLWIAAEPFEKEWAAYNGVDLDRLLILNPYEAEDAFDIALFNMENNLIDLCVLDSVAALCPSDIVDKDTGQRHMGVDARVVGQFCKKTGPAWNRATAVHGEARTGLIVINQVRDKLGSKGGPEGGGGRGLKHHKSLDLYFKRKDFITNNLTAAEKKIVFGATTTVKLKKVKITGAKFWSVSSFDFYSKDCPDKNITAGTIDNAKDVRVWGCSYKLIEYKSKTKTRNPSFRILLNDDDIGGDNIDEAKLNLDTYLRENDDVCMELESQIREIVRSGS